MIEIICLLSPVYVALFWGLVHSFSFPSKNQPKIVLALFMFSSLFIYIGHTVFFLGSHLQYSNYEPFYIFTDLLVYPLFYIYIRLLTVDNRLASKHLSHFIPAVFITLPMIYLGSVMDDNQKIDYFQFFLIERNINSFEIFSTIWFRMVLFLLARVIFIFQVFYTLLNGIILIKQHEESILNYYSTKEGKSLAWLKIITIAFLFTSCTSIILAIVGRNQFVENSHLLLIPSAIFSVMIFTIGFQGTYIQYIPVSRDNNQTQTNVGGSRDELKEKLLELFDKDRIFKNPELDLKEVSKSIKSDNSKVANLINDEFKVNFRDFVNQYRISVAKTMITDDIEKKLTIDDIAIEAGFSDSKSFVRVFKEYEGMNPIKFKEVMDGLKD